MKKKVIFISFDGILDNLGKSQITSYLFKLNNYYKITLVSLENKNKTKEDFINIKKKYTKNNIDWIKFNFSKIPIVGFFINFIKVFFVILFLIVFKRHRYFHCRSLVPAIICYYLNIFFKIQYLFDMRGFWIDEKSDRTNLNKKKISYKYIKYLENKIFHNSSQIISLTNQAKDIIQKENNIDKDKIHVIPTCVDINKFTRNKKLNNKNELNFCYLGTIDGAYDIEIVLNYFNKLNKIHSKAYLKILTNQQTRLKKLLLKYKNNKNIKYYSVNNEKIVDYLNDTDFGIFYLKDNYSIKASFPTKISEYLSLGIPIITNPYNLDIKSILKNNKIGTLINFDKLEINNDLRKYFDFKDNYSEISVECKNYCKTNLSLDVGVEKYFIAYNKAFI